MGAKRLGMGGETTRVENRGETTREETSCGRNVLLPLNAQLRETTTRHVKLRPAKYSLKCHSEDILHTNKHFDN